MINIIIWAWIVLRFKTFFCKKKIINKDQAVLRLKILIQLTNFSFNKTKVNKIKIMLNRDFLKFLKKTKMKFNKGLNQLRLNRVDWDKAYKTRIKQLSNLKNNLVISFKKNLKWIKNRQYIPRKFKNIIKDYKIMAQQVSLK